MGIVRAIRLLEETHCNSSSLNHDHRQAAEAMRSLYQNNILQSFSNRARIIR